MRFLVDASLPRSAATLLRQHGHDAEDVRDIGMGIAPDELIAARAQTQQVALISADFDFADIRIYPPAAYLGLVVIDRPEDATITQVLELIERLLNEPDIISALPGKLVIVDHRRIRVRAG